MGIFGRLLPPLREGGTRCLQRVAVVAGVLPAGLPIVAADTAASTMTAPAASLPIHYCNNEAMSVRSSI